MNKITALMLTIMPLVACAYEIIGPKAPKPADPTAIKELKDYLAQMVEGDKLTINGKGGVTFYVGDTDFARAEDVMCAEMLEEEWLVRSVDNNVILAGGGERGTLYAVYHFLEDDCGVRWWSEHEEDVPERGALKLPTLKSHSKPVFVYRDVYRSEFGNIATSELAVRRRLNRNGDVPINVSLGGSVAFGPPYYCHTFDHYIPWEKYGKTRPELFSLVDGKRCGGQNYNEGGQLCLSNPEVYQIIRDGLLANATNSIIEAQQNCQSVPIAFEVSMNDNCRYCQCDKCKAEMAEGGVTAQYFDFVNRLAADLKTVRPDAYVSTLAYYFTEEPPSNSVRAADNVIVKLCNTRSNLAASFFAAGDNTIMRDLLDCWDQLCKHLLVWDYDMTFSEASMGLPFPSEFHFDGKFRFYDEHHVKGMFWQQTLDEGEDLPELKFYLKTKLMEDPYINYAELLKRAYNDYFGTKAGPIIYAARHRMVEAQERNHGRLLWFPQMYEWNFIRAEDLAFMNAKWDEAEALTKANAKHYRRVCRARIGLKKLTEHRTAHGTLGIANFILEER